VNLFILAAGLGTRLRPLTNKYPKPCVPFLNVPMGLYQYRFLNDLPIKSRTANSFHLPEQIANLYRQHNTSISAESGKISGSAGGLLKASKYFDMNEDTILMMNADEIFFTADQSFIKKAYEQHISHQSFATLVVMKHPEAGQKFGAIWCDTQNKVQSIMAAKNKPDQILEPYHYIGIIFLNKKILKLIPEDIETNIFYDILIHELKNQSVEIYNLECSWYETGNPQDYLAATKQVLASLDSHTHNFINIYDKSRLIKNPTGLSLVSESLRFDESKLAGYNVISKSANLSLLNSSPLIDNSVIFDSEILNTAYFALG
jgi:mannose-1-phosphate guanylyltransferase